MKKKMYSGIKCHVFSGFLLILFSNHSVFSQDFSNLKTADPLHVNGNLGWNQIFYASNRAMPARQPQTWVFNGTLNLNFFNIIQAPFTFNYSNAGSKFTQPNFNQSSFHPGYKWIKLHLGTISQSWGAYTVNGHVFRGAALELTPGRWNIAALYGRFQKAVHPDTPAGSLSVATFLRMGEGFRLGYTGNKTLIAAQIFHAKDDPHSIAIPAYSLLTPMENTCGGLQFQQQFSPKLRFTSDLGISKLNQDLRNNQSTGIYSALKLGLNYHLKFVQLQGAYEKVDPGYRTLGAYYFNNDLENITAGFSMQLAKGKMQLQANTGRQHDNLDLKKRSQMTRSILNASLSVQPSPKLGFNATYSNFLSYTNLRPFTDFQNTNNPYLAWDTLNFRQISENIQLGLNAALLADSIKKLSFHFSGTRQRSLDQQGETKTPGNYFYNLSAGLSLLKMKTGTSLSLAANAGQIAIGDLVVQNFCPVLSVSNTFRKKTILTQLSLSETNSYTSQGLTGQVLNIRGSARYTYHKKHNFSLSLQYLHRHDAPITTPYNHQNPIREFTAFLGYTVAGELLSVKRGR